MSFTVDKQTLEDLNLLGKYKANSIFNVFNHTRTRGGNRILEAMFQHPLSDAETINSRSGIFQYFQDQQIEFPVDTELFETVEHYFSNPGSSNFLSAIFHNCRHKLLHDIGADQEYMMLHQGVTAVIKFLKLWNHFFTGLAQQTSPSPYDAVIQQALSILQAAPLRQILLANLRQPLPLTEFIRYDYILRSSYFHPIEQLLHLIYECDVYITVSKVARERKFIYAQAHPFAKDQNKIDIQAVFHPQIPHAIPNDIAITHRQNVIFLTGANMAGKSTFMKSFSIAIYLAHMGFPVAASHMEFSVQEGLYTSINVPDNLNMGYSHFYAEVLRVKHIAQEVSKHKNLVIVFDELFKGTNVKDAYDATTAVTEAFSAYQNCFYMISTHIIEAGQTLKTQCNNFKFIFLPTIMKGNIPTYTYKLQEGITNDRHGMMIINNEHIVDIIRGNASNRNHSKNTL